MKKFEALKAKLKREDFQFLDGWFESVVKPPGSMHEQQFQVADCEDCSLMILDPSACVNIDECKYCYFFIGPCEASVFIRDCEKCVVICCTRQFRMRDCKDCSVALWCESQPVIESSDNIMFDCFPDWGYSGLAGQFTTMKFSVWNNNWWDVYDFTKNKDRSNYRFVKMDEEKLLRKSILTEALGKQKMEFIPGVVPLAYGCTLQPTKTVVFAVREPIGTTFRTGRPRLIKSRRSKLGEYEKQALGLQNNEFLVFLQFSLSEIAAAKETLFHTSSTIVKIFENLTEEQNLLIFVPFKDHR